MQDADSLDKAGTKKEGAFYMWTSQEIREVLGDAAPLFISYYYVKDEGNADLNPRSDPHGEFGGLNCLRQAQTLQETAKQAGVSEEEARQTLAACREKLHTRRGQRPRPHLDDKVSTHTHTHTHTRTHARTHAHTHTHTNGQEFVRNA